MATSLAEFLANRDVPCPGCEYNLRGLTGETCPECGKPVSLATFDIQPVRESTLYIDALAWIGLIGLWWTMTLFGSFVVVVVFAPAPAHLKLLIGSGWIGVMVGLATFGVRERHGRRRRLPEARHWIAAFIAWGFVLAVGLAMFLLAA